MKSEARNGAAAVSRVTPRAAARAVIAAMLLVPVGFWARRGAVGPGSVPLLSAGGRGFWLLGLAVALATGVLYAVWRDAPLQRASWARPEARDDDTVWALPLVVSLTGVLLLQVYHSVPEVAVIAVGAGAVLLVGSGLRGAFRTGVDPSREQSVYTLMVHTVAFFALSMVYVNKLRSLYSASAVFALATLLVLALIDQDPAPFARRLVYALSGGIILGEITWVLNYWRATGWTGGAALLIFFYLIGGLILTQLRGAVRRREVAEFGAVSALGLAIVTTALLR